MADLNSLQRQLQDLYRQSTSLQQSQPPFQSQTQFIPNQIQIPVPPTQIHYVDGFAGAKLYQDEMQPNSSEIIMDKNENIFYAVSKDANGTPSRTIPIGRNFVIEESKAEEPTFLTRQDFDQFKEEVKQLLMEQRQTQLNTPAAKAVTKKT